MNSASWSFFVRANVIIANLMVLLFVVATLSPETFSTQSITENSVSIESVIKSPGPLRKLPKRPGYRQLA